MVIFNPLNCRDYNARPAPRNAQKTESRAQGQEPTNQPVRWSILELRSTIGDGTRKQSPSSPLREWRRRNYDMTSTMATNQRPNWGVYAGVASCEVRGRCGRHQHQRSGYRHRWYQRRRPAARRCSNRPAMSRNTGTNIRCTAVSTSVHSVIQTDKRDGRGDTRILRDAAGNNYTCQKRTKNAKVRGDLSGFLVQKK